MLGVDKVSVLKSKDTGQLTRYEQKHSVKRQQETQKRARERSADTTSTPPTGDIASGTESMYSKFSVQSPFDTTKKDFLVRIVHV